MFFMLCFCMTIVLKVLNKRCIIGNSVHIVLDIEITVHDSLKNITGKVY